MIRPLALTRQVWHTASQIQRAASLGCPWNNLPRHRNPDTPGPMTEQCFNQHLDPKEAVHPGGPFMIQMLFKTPLQ